MFFVIPFCVRYSAFHSRIFYFYIRPLLPPPPYPCARCRTHRNDQVKFLRIWFAFGSPLPFPLTARLPCSIHVAYLGSPLLGLCQGGNQAPFCPHLSVCVPLPPSSLSLRPLRFPLARSGTLGIAASVLSTFISFSNSQLGLTSNATPGGSCYRPP